MNQLDDGADLVGALSQGFDFAGRILGFGGEALQALGDLGGGLTACQGDVGRFDGLVFFAAQDAGHFGEAALRAGQRAAKGAHALDDGEIALAAQLALRAVAAQLADFGLQGVDFGP